MAAAAADVPRGPARLAGWRYPVTVGALSRVLTFAVIGTIGLLRRTPDQSLGEALLAPFGAWDGTWYQRIADYGYDPTVAHGNGIAFSPLYPMLVRYVHAYLPVSLLVAGVLISSACFFAAMIVLYRLVERRSGQRVARRVIWLTAFFPTAYLFSSVYTESLYLLVTVATFALLEYRRVIASSLMGTLAVLTRPTGILLMPSMGLRIWKDCDRRVSWRFVVCLIPLLLLPIAYVAFGAYLYYRTGNPFATQTAQAAGWGRGVNVLLVLAMPAAILSGLYVGTHDPSRLMYIVVSALGATVEQSSTTAPSAIPSITPSAPSTTASKSGESDTQTTTTSAPTAASAGDAARRAPCATSSSLLLAVRFQTATEWPAASR